MDAVQSLIEAKPPEVATAAKRPRLRLTYLDGLRGIAALYVVLYHTSQIAHGYALGAYPASGGWTAHWQWLRLLVKAAQFAVLNYGHYAVDVFIVLSGYCLMLPVARAGTDRLPNGMYEFMKRRAFRILPPYYAALLLTLVFVALVPGMRRPANVYWDSALPVFGPMNIFTHLLLIHSWGPWAMKINQPMWSVAVEWQIYFLFPLLILPIRKYIGSIATVFVTFFAGVGFYTWTIGRINADWMMPWFLGLFAMGAAAASLAFSSRPRETRLHQNIPWAWIERSLWIVAILLTFVQRKSWEHVQWLQWTHYRRLGAEWPMDLIIGLATMCLIIRLTKQVTDTTVKGAAPVESEGLLRLFESKPAVKLGLFSYSLYLVHMPVVSGIDLACRELHLGPAGCCLVMFFVAFPAALILGYVFHLFFEAPWMHPPQARTLQVRDESAAALPINAIVAQGGLPE
jgi:peptidoglycan/LPS O-acetylase OafA/YrhL